MCIIIYIIIFIIIYIYNYINYIYILGLQIINQYDTTTHQIMILPFVCLNKINI